MEKENLHADVEKHEKKNATMGQKFVMLSIRKFLKTYGKLEIDKLFKVKSNRWRYG